MSVAGDERELTERARAGDHEAFSALCERSRDRLWRIVSSVAPGPDREDLAQEAVVRAWCAIGSYRSEATFEAWLCRIALNAAHDYQRSAWKRRIRFWLPGEVHESPTEPLERVAERREAQRRVRRAVAALPPAQRTPIWLHYFEGFSLADVARLERAAESTLRSRVQAGLRRLSVELKDLQLDELENPVRLEPEARGWTL